MFLGAGSTERQAIDALAGVTVAASKGDAVRVSREPFAAFADRWLEDRAIDLAPTTAATYRWHLEKWIKPSRHLRKPISKITQQDVAAFILDLKRRESRAGAPLKGWTIRGAVSVLSAILQEAVEQGVLAVQPRPEGLPQEAREGLGRDTEANPHGHRDRVAARHSRATRDSLGSADLTRSPCRPPPR